jgi:hypothetical protein
VCVAYGIPQISLFYLTFLSLSYLLSREWAGENATISTLITRRYRKKEKAELISVGQQYRVERSNGERTPHSNL